MPNICLNCVSNRHLRELIARGARRRRCKYCGATAKGVTIEEVAAAVDGPFRRAYGWGRQVPTFDLDSDKTYYDQAGDDLNWVLQAECGIDYDAADELINALNEIDPSDPTDGDSPFYDDSQNYERVEIEDDEFRETWFEFSERVKHNRRFFDEVALQSLERIFGEVGSDLAAELPAVEVGPGHKIERVFRARRAASAKDARKLLAQPASELSAPPPRLASAGRMNPAGISVFYGAIAENVAVSEMRPSIGGLVVVGSFMVKHQLRILDLTQLGSGSEDSIFAPDYYERCARRKFLSRFHYLITRPVQASDEVIDYLPTQVVAEYVGRVLRFDGILYGSAQIGRLDDLQYYDESEFSADPEECNIVLWGVPNEPGDSDIAPAHPLLYEDGSAQVAWVTRVQVAYTTVDISDERGYDSEHDGDF